MDLIDLAFLEELEDKDNVGPPPVPVRVRSFKSRRTQCFYDTLRILSFPQFSI